MASSDEEYAEGPSLKRGGGSGTRDRNVRRGGRERWEDVDRSWDLVTEGADGSLTGTIEGLVEASKRKRLLRDTTPLQRGIIRHLVLILDLSSSMNEKDLRPTRYHLTLRYAEEFIAEFFSQNPISQLGIIGMRDGLATRIADMSGNPQDHLNGLQQLRTGPNRDPKGNPSLQNALEMARGALYHTPSHGTREVVIVYGALLSSDPSDIHNTISSLVRDSIRVSIVGLAARIAICTELCAKTNSVSNEYANAHETIYGIALHEQHFRDLLLSHTTPPVTRKGDASAAATLPSLLMMGFPSRIEEDSATLCACHAARSRGGYLCSRCKAKVCSLPAQCPVCELQLIQSTHLARSYHHLFPLRNYEEVSWKGARAKVANNNKSGIGKSKTCCFSCLTPFPPIPDHGREQVLNEDGSRRHVTKTMQKGASESSRYACTVCGEHFCIDCDVFAHEVMHNCPGCMCKPQTVTVDEADGAIMNGNATT